MSNPQEPSEFKYWAFLSYSHEDKEFVVKVQKAMERYRIPRAARKSATEAPVPKRLKLYRDRTEARAAPDLPDELEKGLLESRYLVVVCSPASAALRFDKDGERTSWVNEEIRYFQRTGRADRVLTLIREGEPNASHPDKVKEGADPDQECYPPALRWKVDAQGAPTSERANPLSADARREEFHDAMLKLIAPIIGVKIEDLKQQDRTRKWREAALAGLATIAFTGALVVAGMAITNAQESARRTEAAQKAALEAKKQEEKEAALKRAAPYLSAAKKQRSQGSYGSAALLSARALIESTQVDTSPQDVVNDLAMALVPNHVHPRRSLVLRSAWNGSVLALGDASGHVQAWQWERHHKRWECAWLSTDGHGEALPGTHENLPPIRDMGWTNAKGGAFLSAGEDGMLRAFRASDGASLWTWAAKDEHGVVHDVLSVAAEPVADDQEPRILVGDADGGMWLLPWKAKEPRLRWQAHQGWVRMVRWHPKGELLASASADGTVRLWDGKGDGVGRELHALSLPQSSARFQAMAFSPKGRWIAAGGDAGVIGIWDVTSGSLHVQMKALTPSSKDFSGVKALVWLDEQHLLSGAADGRILLWDADGGGQIREVSSAAPGAWGPSVYWLEALPSGQLAVGRWAGLSIEDLETGRTLHRMEGLENEAFLQGGGTTDDGKYLAVSVIDPVSWVRVYDSESQRQVRAFPSPRRTRAEMSAFPAPTAVGLSQDGGRIAWSERGGAIRVSSMETGDTLHLVQGSWTDRGAARLSGGDIPVVSLTWSTNGELLASCGREVSVWDAGGAFGKVREVPVPARETPNPNAIHAVQCAFVPGTEMLATAAILDREVLIWDARKGTAPVTVLRGLPPDAWILNLSASADGRFLAVGTNTGLVSIWNTQTGQLIRISRVAPEAADPSNQRQGTALIDPTVASYRQVLSVTFAPTAAAYAVGLGDGSLQLLHTKTGNVLARAPAVEARRSHLSAVGESFTPVGRLVTVGVNDGAIRWWDRGWTASASGKLGRSTQVFDTHVLSPAPDGTGWLSAVGSARSGNTWDVQGKAECNHYALGLKSVSAATWLDGKKAVLATTGGELVVIRRDGGNCVEDRRIPPPPGAQGLLQEILDQKEVQLHAPLNTKQNLPVTSLAVDREHHLLASVWVGNAVWLLDLATWKWRTNPLRSSADVQSSGFLLVQATPRPGHTEMAAIDRGGRITLWSTSNGRVRWEAKGWTTSLERTPIAFSPDGRILAAGGEGSNVLLLDAESGTSIGDQLPTHGSDPNGAYRISSVVWLRKGRMLATVGADNMLRLWEIAEQGDKRSAVLAGLAPVFPLPFLMSGVPEGASPARRAELERIRQETRQQLPIELGLSAEPDDLSGVIYGLAVAKDDRTIAVASSDGVFLYDADTLVADMAKVTGLESSAFKRWVEERTGMRIVDGEQVMLRYANGLVPQAESAEAHSH